MAVDSNGNLYAAGSFRQVGSLIVNCIEKWDGGRWSSLGTGISSGTPTNIYALAIDNSGNLYAAGDFTKAGGGSALDRKSVV